MFIMKSKQEALDPGLVDFHSEKLLQSSVSLSNSLVSGIHGNQSMLIRKIQKWTDKPQAQLRSNHISPKIDEIPPGERACPQESAGQNKCG